MQLFSILLLLTALVLGGPISGNALHIGVVVMPEIGHFNPMLSIIQELLRKGDTVTAFAPSFFATWMKDITYDQLDNVDQRSRLHWEVYMDYDRSHVGRDFFARLIAQPPLESLVSVEAYILEFNRNVSVHLFEYLNNHYQTPANDAMMALSNGRDDAPIAEKKSLPDIFLSDFATYGGTYAAEAVGKEVIILWPMTLSFPLLQNFNVPFMGTGFSFDMTYPQRLANLALYFVGYFMTWKAHGSKDEIRAAIGLPPSDHLDLYYRHPIITPSVFGLDISQPLCPNFFPLGLLLPDLNPAEALDKEWSDFLGGCSEKGVIYINMGSVAILPDEWAASFSEGVRGLADDGFCVAWKRRFKTDVVQTAETAWLFSDQVKVFERVNFSPRLILAHPNVKTFITHCGDTSVYEAVAANTPLVGIPLFADQPDVCARVVDAGLGAQISKYEITKEAMFSAVTTVVNNEAAIRDRMRYLVKTAQVQGMQTRAAEVVHMLFHLGKDGAKGLYCEHVDEPWYRIFDVDVYVMVSILIFTSIHIMKYCCKCVCCCNGKKRQRQEA